MPHATPEAISAFITRWETSGAAERANYQMFLSELCDIIGVPRPDPTSPDPTKNRFVFDRAITRINPDGSTSTNYIDLYKAGHFVCETKQGLNDCSGGLRPSQTTLAPNTLTDGHRPPLQTTLAPGTASNDCSGGLRPSLSTLAPGSRTDGHRPPLQTKTGHGKRGTLAFDKALERAFHQGRGYITALPADEGRPPFLIVCDVGHSIDLYAEFTCTGGQYERFPDPVSYRITLPDLHRPEIRARLRNVWLDPHSLDPSKVAAKVTRDIAGRLAQLAKSLEADQHDPHVIAGFLQRCLFTMFAEDIGLLPENGFKSLLDRVKETPAGFPVVISGLWKEMATGTHFSALLFKEIAHFNGGLFENTTAIQLSAAQLNMLIDAAATDWSGVEPSIFGTLLVRALDPRERHKLGAEYTPRSYVERLIRPTIIGPLRDEWDTVRIAAATLHDEADQAETQADSLEIDAKAKLAAGDSAAAKQLGADATRLRKDAKKCDAEALAQVITFHRHLCGLTVLDPACGTANFLYVTMEHMKRLEAEVLQLINALGGNAGMEMQGFRVRPEHFIGLEINKQAVAIAQLVLWIGYFQWQHKTTGKADTGDRPLLPKDRSIFEQDAVLAYDQRTPRRDPETHEILTVWDGHTTKPHPITGKEVPDESARTVLFDYQNPRRAEWPKADYIVGNPPFIGKLKMRDALGDGYTESLRKAWKGDVPDSADFVMYWWRKAAELVSNGKVKRFGFITTNSIHQTFNRRILESVLNDAKKPLHLAYAIPDHPWIDSTDAAAVRIAMTVVAPSIAEGILEKVTSEIAREDGENEVTLEKSGGVLAANLQIGANITSCPPLQSNSRISNTGLILGGRGFVIDKEEASHLLRSSEAAELMIAPIWNGKDVTDRWREFFVIDTHGLNEEDLAQKSPEIWQHLKNTVYPERQTNRDPKLKKLWWLFRRANTEVRDAMAGLTRYIATSETAKHRCFVFLSFPAKPEHKLVVISHDDAYVLGVLSSSIHAAWALKIGSQLGPTPVYVKSACFEPFPFPALEEGELKQRIRDLGERLDAHRKRQQAQHPDLTLTGMYNVLEKLRSGEPLNPKDKQIHDQGLVSVLKQIHDDLDAAVLEAYGWNLKGSAGVSPASSSSSSSSQSGQDAHAPLADLLARGGPDAEALEQTILTCLVALNHERAEEEKRGLIRWLRPDYQNPASSDGRRPPQQSELEGVDTSENSTSNIPHSTSHPWPETLPEQVSILRKLLPAISQDPEADSTDLAERLAACFGRKNKKRTEQITGILATLKALGHL